ncbi:MAG TPA: tetratricopeptide repeat protein, partial [Vicinamibacteria bacterium]|nr:tetratricopeptide repeat protein [Vicinamibacteria bacterium]
PSFDSPASVTPPPAASEPAPIPLVAAEEDFELERPYEAPRTSGAAASAAPAAARARGPSATPPAARPSAEPPMMEFEFDAVPGPTIPFAPPPAPAPAPAVAAPPRAATPPPAAPAAPETRAAFEPPPHSPVRPVAAKTVEVPWAAPAPPASVAAPVPTFAPEPEPAPSPAPAPEGASSELMSATLAELYFKQGFAEKAVEVYRQLVEREPENDRLSRRLAELQDTRSAPAAAPHAGTEASRRVALERTIAKLEGMLAAIKKG